jgi:hypothetical protein
VIGCRLDTSPNHVEIRTPKKFVQARSPEVATVGKAKVKIANAVDLDAEQLLFSSKSADDKLLKELSIAHVRGNAYRSLRIRFSDGLTAPGSFAGTETIRSTKQMVAKRLHIPVDSIRFDIDVVDDEEELQDIELPESGIIKGQPIPIAGRKATRRSVRPQRKT